MNSITDKPNTANLSQTQSKGSPSASPDSHRKKPETNSYFTLPLNGYSSQQGTFSFLEPVSPGALTRPPRPRSRTGRNGGALGKNTRSLVSLKNQGLTSEVFLQVNSATGEVEVYKHGKNGSIRRQVDRATARLEKWDLMDCMQRVLKGQRHPSQVKRFLE